MYYLTEDELTRWAKKENALLFTRTEKNIDTYNYTKKENIIVVITGHINIINIFFDKIINKINSKIVLIIIEEDKILLEKKDLDNDKIIHCFSWNKPFIDKKLSSLPIGLNFKRHYETLLRWLKKNKINEEKIIEREKLVCFNCDLDASEDRKILKQVIENKLKKICDQLPYIKPKKSYKTYSFADGRDIIINVTDEKCYDNWKNYKFILSPEGGGIDCHRTWEALMIGCVPIVKTSLINDLYEDLPVLIVNDWNELSLDLLNKTYKTILLKKINKEYNYKKLYSLYWKKIIKFYLNF